MKTVGLDDISEESFNEEALLTIDMLRTGYPKLDLRKGTVLRDLLVNPDATLSSAMRAQVEECRKSSSLKALAERAEAGETVDRDDVDAILSNFNMAQSGGTKAAGLVRVIVSDVRRKYSVAKGAVFRESVSGIDFAVSSDTEALLDPIPGQTELHRGTGDTGWFLVPLECSADGSAGNIDRGTVLDPMFSMYGFVSSAAYGTFSGGSDLEKLDKTVSRIRSSLSMRGLTSAPAVEASLRDAFDGSDSPVVAVSVCGYGNDAQLRDKHNLFGVGVGGRSDVYVRNFTDIPTEAVTRKAYPVDGEEGSYVMSIAHGDEDYVPGMYCVRRVSDPDTDALSSYRHEERWLSGGLGTTWHDIHVDGSLESVGHRETAGTVWRDVEIKAVGIDPDPSVVGPDGEIPLRVELVRLPMASEIQGYLDSGEVRNIGADFVARCPVVVQMSIRAVVRHDSSTPFDKDAAIADICSYVNTSGFVSRVTRSEISSILIAHGARSVDLFDENKMLYGFGYDAYGRKFELSGDALDVCNARSPGGMVTESTCVFCLEPVNVQIKAIPV